MTAVTLAVANLPPPAQRVAYAKRLRASKIDPHLDGEQYQTWLQTSLGPDATISWGADDCGEGGDGRGPVPLCVTAQASLSPRGRVVVSIAIGTSDAGIGGKPGFFFGQIEGLGPTEILQGGDLYLLPTKLRVARQMDAKLSSLPDRALDEDAWVREIRNMPASRFAAGLADMTLAGWVAERAGPQAQTKWFVEGCGHHGPPVTLTGENDEWAFVDSSFDDSTVHVLIQIKVGTCRKGPAGAPAVTIVQVYDKRPGHIHIQLESLGTLAAALMAIRH
jgi:hypothetical protein